MNYTTSSTAQRENATINNLAGKRNNGNSFNSNAMGDGVFDNQQISKTAAALADWPLFKWQGDDEMPWPVVSLVDIGEASQTAGSSSNSKAEDWTIVDGSDAYLGIDVKDDQKPENVHVSKRRARPKRLAKDCKVSLLENRAENLEDEITKMKYELVHKYGIQPPPPRVHQLKLGYYAESFNKRQRIRDRQVAHTHLPTDLSQLRRHLETRILVLVVDASTPEFLINSCSAPLTASPLQQQLSLWDLLHGPDSEAEARNAIKEAIRGRLKANLKIACYLLSRTDRAAAVATEKGGGSVQIHTRIEMVGEPADTERPTTDWSAVGCSKGRTEESEVGLISDVGSNEIRDKLAKLEVFVSPTVSSLGGDFGTLLCSDTLCFLQQVCA